jgi:hypothetical protein
MSDSQVDDYSEYCHLHEDGRNIDDNLGQGICGRSVKRTSLSEQNEPEKGTSQQRTSSYA